MSDDEETFGEGATMGVQWQADDGAVQAMEEIRREAGLSDPTKHEETESPMLGRGAAEDELETFLSYDEEPRTRVAVPAPAAPLTPTKRETPLAQLKPSPWMTSVWSSKVDSSGGWGAAAAGWSPSGQQATPTRPQPAVQTSVSPNRAPPMAYVQPMMPQQSGVPVQTVPDTIGQRLAQQVLQQQQAMQLQLLQQQQLLAQRQAQLAAMSRAQGSPQKYQQQQVGAQPQDPLSHIFAKLQMAAAQQQRPGVTSAADLEMQFAARRQAPPPLTHASAMPPPLTAAVPPPAMAATAFGVPVPAALSAAPGAQPQPPQAQAGSQPPAAQPASEAPPAEQKPQPRYFQPPVRQQTYEPFIRDPSEPLQWKGGKKYMRPNEIGDIVTSHYEMLRSPAPYVEDYYRLNYLHKLKLGTAQQLQYLQQHKPVADAVQHRAKFEALAHPYILGKIPFTSSKTPRPTVALTAEEGGVDYEADHIGAMKGEHYSVHLGVENTLLLITDTEDLDHMINSTASLPNIELLQTYLKKRRVGLGDTIALYIAALGTEHPKFISEALSMRKGAAMLMRALRLMPTSARITVAQCYVRSFGAFTPAQTELRHQQLEIAQIVVEAARAASAKEAAQLLASFARAYRTPDQWASLLRLSEMICVAGAVMQRGGELNLHKTVQLPEGSSPEDARAMEQTAALWRDSYSAVHRHVVEALVGVHRARTAGMSAVPPVSVAPLPSAVWNMLAALALLSSTEQKEILRGVVGAVVGVGGLEQSSTNPAVLALHHILLH